MSIKFPSKAPLTGFIAEKIRNRPTEAIKAKYLVERLVKFYLEFPKPIEIEDREDISLIRRFQTEYIDLKKLYFEIYHIIKESTTSIYHDDFEDKIIAVNDTETIIQHLRADITYLDSLINQINIEKQIELVDKTVLFGKLVLLVSVLTLFAMLLGSIFNIF